jgi:hypothetical protein
MAAAPKPAPGGKSVGRFRAFLELFSNNPLGHLLFSVAIIIGFFHGWLKNEIRHWVITFVFDIPLTLALVVTLAKLPRMQPWFPDCRIGKSLNAFVGISILYLILPFGVPFLIGLSALRAWIFAPIIFLLGYHLTRSIRQIEAYFWLLILLGAITALYGLFQTPEEIKRRMETDPEFAQRFINTFYGNAKGEAKLRVFSTFVSAAAFGGVMAYTIMFAVARFSVEGNTWIERTILIALAVPMAYGIILSGSRTSLMMMASGLIYTSWYRRNLLTYLVAPTMIIAGYAFGQEKTGGDSLERFVTLLDPSVLWGRLYIVLSPTVNSLVNYPLGGGLGRSGNGIPFVLVGMFSNFDFRAIDGEAGRLVVDMGIVGMIVYCYLIISGSADAIRNMSKLRDTPLSVIGVPAGAMFLIAVSTIFTGSPFLAIPSGPLFWFFLGALERLTQEYGKLEAAAPGQAKFSDMFVSFIQPPRQRLLFTPSSNSGAQPERIEIPPFDKDASQRFPQRNTKANAKRFLYRR